jgi:hypothetical protein
VCDELIHKFRTNVTTFVDVVFSRDAAFTFLMTPFRP